MLSYKKYSLTTSGVKTQKPIELRVSISAFDRQPVTTMGSVYRHRPPERRTRYQSAKTHPLPDHDFPSSPLPVWTTPGSRIPVGGFSRTARHGLRIDQLGPRERQANYLAWPFTGGSAQR